MLLSELVQVFIAYGYDHQEAAQRAWALREWYYLVGRLSDGTAP